MTQRRCSWYHLFCVRVNSCIRQPCLTFALLHSNSLRHAQASGARGPLDCLVEWCVNGPTDIGQLYLCGNAAALGAWKVASAVPMKYEDGIWRTQVMVPAGKVYTYKCETPPLCPHPLPTPPFRHRLRPAHLLVDLPMTAMQLMWLCVLLLLLCAWQLADCLK